MKHPPLPNQHQEDPSNAQMLDVCQTLSGLSSRGDEVAARLQYISDLLGDATNLPAQALLVWRLADRSVKHHVLNDSLVVGRQPSGPGLSFPDDSLLSRRHFSIRVAKDRFLLNDLGSHNGTSINDPERKTQERILRDGDLILAGKQIFAFLDQRKID